MHADPHFMKFAADFLIVVIASVLVLVSSRTLRLSSVVGFLLTGMLIGPSGLGLLMQEEVELFAEIGVVILLFTVGLEFSLASLRRSWRPFLAGGGMQVGGTILVTALIAAAFSMPIRAGLFLGFMAALSSTAIVLKAYSDRNELRSPQGSLVTGILLFQDFCLAPMIVLAPVLGGAASASAASVLGRLGIGVLLVAAAFVLARLVVPRVLHWIVRTRIREVFLLGSLGTCLGMGMLTANLGFSMALGAFLAGLVLSESEYGHQVSAEVLPFRDLFNSLFFVSLGMLFHLDTLRVHPWLVLGLGAGLVIGKTLVTAIVVRLLGYPSRTALITGLSLAQVGEFSFVLAAVGLGLGLLDGEFRQVFLGASIFTMMLTPGWIALAPRFAARASQVHLPVRWRQALPEPSERLRHALVRWRPDPGRSEAAAAPLKGHVILVGYGTNGRNVARVLRETAIPFVLLELNGELVRAARADGLPVIYGDATRAEMLNTCGARTASLLVLAISDLVATRQAVRIGRDLNPDLGILVRTRAVSEIEELLRLGADEVIPEEFETSIEIFSRVLLAYHIPRNVIDAQVRILRDEAYGALRGTQIDRHAALERVSEFLEGTLTETFLVRSSSWCTGKSLRDLDLRQRTSASVIALVRGGKPTTSPSPDDALRAADTLVLVGGHAALEAAFKLLESGE